MGPLGCVSRTTRVSTTDDRCAIPTGSLVVALGGGGGDAGTDVIGGVVGAAASTVVVPPASTSASITSTLVSRSESIKLLLSSLILADVFKISLLVAVVLVVLRVDRRVITMDERTGEFETGAGV